MEVPRFDSDSGSMFARDNLLDEDVNNEGLYEHLRDLVSNQLVFEKLVQAFNGAFDENDAVTDDLSRVGETKCRRSDYCLCTSSTA